MLTQRIGSVLPYGARQRLFALRRRIAQMRQEDWYIEDWAERAHLFRHVFEMLEFNGIDGDYAEFGYGSRTFSLAYWESRRAGLRPKLWGFDSFQGLPPQSANDGHVRWIAGTMNPKSPRPTGTRDGSAFVVATMNSPLDSSPTPSRPAASRATSHSPTSIATCTTRP